MKTRTIITLLAVTAVGGIGYAGYRYFKREKDLLQDYQVKPVALEVVKFTGDEVIIKFTLRITNKSNIEAVMKKLSADIYIKDVFIGYVVNDNQAVIPAKGTGDIKLQAAFSPKLILKNAVDIILEAATIKDLPYALKGYVDIQSGFVPVSVPFENSGKLGDFF